MTRMPKTPEIEVDLRRFRNYPALTYHYGLDYLAILRMPVWLRDIYIEELPGLIAQRQLLAIEAAATPHMEKNDAEKTVRHLQRIIEEGHTLEQETTKQATLSEEMYQQHMASAGIPITFVRKGEEVTDA